MEYAFSQTALRGRIDPTVKSKWEKMGVRACRGGEGGETKEEETTLYQRQIKKLLCAWTEQQYLLDVSHHYVFSLFHCIVH